MRKFLYFIVAMILLAACVLFALRLFGDELTQIALVPSGEFVEQDPLATNAYDDPDMWFARPDKRLRNDPARWQPQERADGAAADAGPVEPAEAPGADSPPSDPRPVVSGAEDPGDTPRFAVFFVHPTSFLDRSRWNAPLDDAESQARARIYVRGLASAFNRASEIWVPRYRQATFGAYLTDAPAATRAIDAAYRDVSQAFDVFLARIPADMPIVLAGHSQGAQHITRLLAERIAGTPLQDRVAMAYPVGWPISVAHDLPSLGLPGCTAPTQGGCIASWSSFAEPAEPGAVLERYSTSPGLDGIPRAETPILCVNPLTGTRGGTAPPAANLGTLVPNADLDSGELVPHAIGARCDERGLLLIGDPPELGPYVLPGNNYHVYDIPLFWRNLQEDVVRRVAAWTARRAGAQ